MRNPIILFILCFLVACGSKNDKKLFTRLDGDDTGIKFINWNNETEQTNILVYEYLYNGGGVALGDINNDGLLDVYFTSNDNENKLYLNKGNFKFEDITTTSGAACKEGWKTGVCMADVNADGWLDIYVSRSAHSDPALRKNALLINKGNLTFIDEAEKYGLADESYSTQAAFFDYDHDGDLDAFLLNHSLIQISNSFDIVNRHSTNRYPYVGNKFLRNDSGKFVDVSDSLGVFGPPSNYGLGIALSDLNNDGWVDVYATSDYTGRDKFLLNNHGKSFTDVTDSLLSHISKFSMGIDIADINNDGWMDIYTLDMLPEDNKRQKLLLGADQYNVFNTMVRNKLHHQYMRNMLQLNNGNGVFSEIGQLAGVSNTDWSWAALFSDFDNDGVEDLFVSNGFKRDLTNSDFAKYHAFNEIEKARRDGKQVSMVKLVEKFNENKIPNYIYRGNGNLTFTNKVKDWGFEEPTLTNGVAYGDLDNDGDLDLVTNTINDVAGIYRNNTETLTKNHYLQLALTGIGNNTGALGARATVFFAGKKIVKELLPVRGFQSSVDPVLHFGLGKNSHVDSVLIQWPTGKLQILKNIVADKKLKLLEPAQGNYTAGEIKKLTYFVEATPTINYTHHENDFVDFNIQSLLPRQYSTQGPALAQADVNKDGLLDLFIGGAKGQEASLYLQNKNGAFEKIDTPAFLSGMQCEDVDATFFDMDNDGDQDLYVVTGGYEFEKDDALLQDKLYRNNGKGIFTAVELPYSTTSGSCVRPNDIDQDGDLDLFVGGRITPGRYPETPTSYMLLNDGKGSFEIANNISATLKNVGMVTDAVWVDLNHDKQDDLIVVGEWMPIEIFLNEKGNLVNHTNQFIHVPTAGWWNTIVAGDFDADGDKDFIVGNVGMNNQVRASAERPASLIYNDFDENGSVDPILNYFILDKPYPYPTRDELVEQVPRFKKRFKDYASYSDATLESILTKQEIENAKKLQATQMQSCYVRNDGDSLVLKPLPIEMQVAPVYSLVVLDVNKDGNLDFFAGGNLSATRSRTGKMTGNVGFIFLGNGKGGFKFVPPLQAGISCKGDVRHAAVNGKKIIIAVNNAALVMYELK